MVQSQGFIPNLKKSDLNPAQQFTFIGMEFLIPQNSQSTTRSYRIPALYNQTVSNSDSSFHSNSPFSFGQTQCCSRLSSFRQTSFRPTSNVSVVSLETSCTSFGSSNFNLEHDPILFEVVGVDPSHFIQGTFIPSPDPSAFLFMDASYYGWVAHLEPMRLSFHGCWTPAPHQYSRNNGHLFCTEKGRTVFTPLLYYDTYSQHEVSYINKQG